MGLFYNAPEPTLGRTKTTQYENKIVCCTAQTKVHKMITFFATEVEINRLVVQTVNSSKMRIQ